MSWHPIHGAGTVIPERHIWSPGASGTSPVPDAPGEASGSPSSSRAAASPSRPEEADPSRRTLRKTGHQRHSISCPTPSPSEDRPGEVGCRRGGRALGRLADGMAEAADTMRSLLTAQSEPVRLVGRGSARGRGGPARRRGLPRQGVPARGRGVLARRRGPTRGRGPARRGGRGPAHGLSQVPPGHVLPPPVSQVPAEGEGEGVPGDPRAQLLLGVLHPAADRHRARGLEPARERRAGGHAGCSTRPVQSVPSPALRRGR